MKAAVKFLWLSARVIALSWIALAGPGLGAQPAKATSATAAPVPVESVAESELLKAYLRMQEQIDSVQRATAADRAEAEKATRAQVATFNEKLERLQVTLEAGRERQRYEREEAEAARERERLEAARVNRTVLWMAGIFGVVGLAAILLVPFFQWRAMHRFVEMAAPRLALPRGDGEGGLRGVPALSTPAEQAVTNSSQRLLTVMDRMERRIVELEAATVTVPAPAAAAVSAPAPAARATSHSTPPVQAEGNSGGGAPTPRPVSATVWESGAGAGSGGPGGSAAPMALKPAAAEAAPSSTTMLLERGRSLLEANRPRVALACYDELLRFDPNNAEALVRKGVALEHLKRDEDALQCYNQAIRADRKKTLAYLCKGAVCSRLGREEESLESYELALRTEEAGA